MLLRRLRIEDERVAAFTLGQAEQAISVARVLRTPPATVAFAARAMSPSGVTTALARWL